METVLSTTFWNNIVYAMKITAPLVRVLRLVDGEKKPPMGYIYEAMDRAKETIKEAMGGQRFERRRWNVQLHQPLHAAGYILNPEFYYNNQDVEPCEEVMKGLYEVIERLIPDLDLQDKIITELAMDSIDPITLRDIDECNEWLIGSMQELVHEDDDLTWDLVAEASGANEQRTRHTRSSSHLQRGGPSGSSQRMVEEKPPLASDETDDEEQYIDANNDDSDGVPELQGEHEDISKENARLAANQLRTSKRTEALNSGLGPYSGENDNLETSKNLQTYSSELLVMMDNYEEGNNNERQMYKQLEALKILNNPQKDRCTSNSKHWKN
ncbi:hypothetical protein HHK36_026414 [Tetracentron sinense]|uniref:Uncharacterized protein n=1 Tax=Tetracentron sinense TaxID=13715 RepID=A0A834YG15_TETSI|nr:hypothetical protein HHK36_026414 [Tetracentron sinense]